MHRPSPFRDDHPETLAEFRAQVLARGQQRSYRANTIVAQEGEPADCMYWVVSGQLVVFVDDPEGRVLELGRLAAGDYFGELILACAVRTASVRTLTDCRLCRLARSELEALVSEQPRLALEIIRMLSERVMRLTGQARSLALADVYSRVRGFIEENAVVQDGVQHVDGVSQQALAEQLGASKSMVNRVLKDLESGGYITLARRTITVKRRLPAAW